MPRALGIHIRQITHSYVTTITYYYYCYLGYCDDCTEIMIDGIRRENNEVVYKNVGDDVRILANTSICHVNEPVVLRFNGSDTSRSNYSGSCSPNGTSHNCNNLATKDTGVYRIHAILDETLGGSEWCSNDVTMKI